MSLKASRFSFFSFASGNIYWAVRNQLTEPQGNQACSFAWDTDGVPEWSRGPPTSLIHRTWVSMERHRTPNQLWWTPGQARLPGRSLLLVVWESRPSLPRMSWSSPRFWCGEFLPDVSFSKHFLISGFKSIFQNFRYCYISHLRIS